MIVSVDRAAEASKYGVLRIGPPDRKQVCRRRMTANNAAPANGATHMSSDEFERNLQKRHRNRAQYRANPAQSNFLFRFYKHYRNCCRALLLDRRHR
jgi:hypothetical protein